MSYSIENGRVVDANGDVAMRYAVNTGKLVSVGKREYLFHTVNNLCIAWVQPEHVDSILAMRKTCCGGHQGNQFFLATEMDARIWLGMSARP